MLNFGVCLCGSLTHCIHLRWHVVTLQAPGNSIHVLMMQSMADWYQRGDKFDQMRLSRILDVAQELKVSELMCLHMVWPSFFDGLNLLRRHYSVTQCVRECSFVFLPMRKYHKSKLESTPDY